jgi:hypothetical protein
MWFLTGLCLVATSASPACAQDEPILKQISTEQTETLLQSLKIDFKKTPAKKGEIVYYDFQRAGHNVRLYWYGGKDLMLDVVFPKMSLEQINVWNVRAKFSRACLHRDNKDEFTALEANLDLAGGVTEGAIRQFLAVFDDEIKTFAKIAGGAAALDEPIYAKVTPERLDAILKGLNIDYKKLGEKDGSVAYEYTANNHQLRLVSFGGEDLMIDAHFKKLPLADVNEYNLQRKFIRCVAYKVEGKEYTSLEANLDCIGGVSDGIIRHFIRAFDEEVQAFTKYVQGK